MRILIFFFLARLSLASWEYFSIIFFESGSGLSLPLFRASSISCSYLSRTRFLNGSKGFFLLIYSSFLNKSLYIFDWHRLFLEKVYFLCLQTVPLFQSRFYEFSLI